jgi:hypothetical protein
MRHLCALPLSPIVDAFFCYMLLHYKSKHSQPTSFVRGAAPRRAAFPSYADSDCCTPVTVAGHVLYTHRGLLHYIDLFIKHCSTSSSHGSGGKLYACWHSSIGGSTGGTERGGCPSCAFTDREGRRPSHTPSIQIRTGFALSLLVHHGARQLRRPRGLELQGRRRPLRLVMRLDVVG